MVAHMDQILSGLCPFWPSWDFLQSSYPSHPPARAPVLICHLCLQAPRGCLVLMNGARASVLTLPSIKFSGCTLKSNSSCWEASATLLEFRNPVRDRTRLSGIDFLGNVTKNNYKSNTSSQMKHLQTLSDSCPCMETL